MQKHTRQNQRTVRHKRVTAKVKGNSERPRLVVFRSHKHVYAQLVNDEKGITLINASDRELKRGAKQKRIAVSKAVGALLAEKAAKIKVQKAVFDRGGYQYHGNIKALADGAREGGLKF